MAEQSTLSSTGSAPNGDVEQFSFERAIEELESIVRRLEDGKVPLEEAQREIATDWIAAYRKYIRPDAISCGLHAAEHCQ